MLPRLTRQDDDEEWEVEKRYGKPQHETSCSTSEQELYGDPQHDVPDECLPSDFDLDVGNASIGFDSSRDTDDDSGQLLLLTER